MAADRFSHVDTWVFDLDNTLYPPEMSLFDQVNARMTAYVMTALGVEAAEADQLRHRYWKEHGTTLAGLMDNHDIDPEPYLDDVHRIDFTVLAPDPVLSERIAALPGRRIIYTNGTAPYAEQVIAHRGLGGLFDAIYGVEHAAFRPKPEARAFDKVFETDGLTPAKAAMFEDDVRNLAVPFARGMKTVHVAPTPDPADHVEFHTDDLSGFLAKLI